MSRNEFWRKNPALELAFFAIWAVFWFALIIAAITNGKINLGRSAKAAPLAAAKDPLAFWAIIGLLSILGIVVPAYNLPRIIRNLQGEQNADERDRPATKS